VVGGVPEVVRIRVEPHVEGKHQGPVFIHFVALFGVPVGRGANKRQCSGQAGRQANATCKQSATPKIFRIYS